MTFLLQLYSLGVPHPDSELLAVHVVVSDAEWHQIEAEGGEAASRRVAEALLFATSMTMLKATGQVSTPHTVCLLVDVCLTVSSKLTVLQSVHCMQLPLKQLGEGSF